MIAKDRDGELCATCDECGSVEYAGTLEFRDFWAGLKAQGWKARGDDEGGWQHTCPDCLGELA